MPEGTLQAFQFFSPSRLVFGPGCSGSIGQELLGLQERLAIGSWLVCSGGGHTRGSAGLRRVLESLDAAGIRYSLFSEVSADPDQDQVRAAVRAIEAGGHQAVLAYGGGSPIDCAKSAALSAANRLDILDIIEGRATARIDALPIVAVPTTAGTGSELSSAAVTTNSLSRRKIGYSNPSLFPRLAVIDPENQSSMPATLTAATGLDALTHLLESFLSTAANPLSDAINLYCLDLVGRHLETAWANPDDMDARSGMAVASALAGLAFSHTGLGMVHGFAHPLGAMHGLAHGTANAILLPYVLAALEADPANQGRLSRASLALSPGSQAEPEPLSLLVWRLARRLGIPESLREAGLEEHHLDPILKDACTYRNRPKSPRAFSDTQLASLLHCAWIGRLDAAADV